MPAIENETGGLNSDQQRELRACAERLKELLQSGAASVDLRGLLPPLEAPHRRAVLHALIKTELEARYARGEVCLLEKFLKQYPELGRSAELPPDLVYAEYRLRRLVGARPELAEYRSRFPSQFEQLRRLVDQELPPGAPLIPGGSGVASTCADPPSPMAPEQATTLPPAVATAQPSAGKGAALVPPGEGYQLLQRIGQGQFGEVYRALAPGGVVVAIKRIFRALDDECSQRELKALQKIRELRHPFLLQTHNYQAFEDRLLIVMELADGSLEERFRECRAAGLPGIPVEELLRYFSEAAEALDFLHQQKLSHRDIKPQNLLHLKGHAKVADFGIARPQQNSLDHTLNIGGTPAYMPPEMWRGDISVHSDQYSLALTWYEMRTGRRPFSAATPLDLAQRHLSEVPDLSGVPEAERNVLLRALAKKPDERFPSCVAFAQALTEALAPPKAPSKPASPAQPRGVKAALAALAFALTALLLLLSIAFWPRVSWQPKGWDPENARDFVEDLHGRRYYRHLVRDVGGQKVVLVAVPQESSTDPATFYAMQNKVWNDLYAVFQADSRSEQLLRKYVFDRPGCRALVRDDWRKGAWAYRFNPDPDKEPFFGVENKGRLPVFRVTVTEAHCFAEWLGGRLPTRQQWRKAAGWFDARQPGPFQGDPGDTNELAVGLKDGPWPVDRGMRDVSVFGCRQMASNGYEWTRDLQDEEQGQRAEIPLEELTLPAPYVIVEGQSYLSGKPLAAFQEMAAKPTYKKCTEAPVDVTFRVVLEP